MKYLLDTCVISELVKPAPNRKVVDWLNEVPSKALFLSVMTIGEIEKGLTKLPDSKKKVRLTVWLNTLLNEYQERILPVDLMVAENWGVLQGNAEMAGAPMSSIDSLLAATTYTHNLTLVTRNESDFVPGITPIVNPWKL
ncbi:MAG: VapC toxin family PIN domain ribonuclease [Deltaproteobacteria bacterium]|nr:MAG: VapC toxin family PIN domain ribonuclease [Deltaproteobacteria bacterium]